MEISIGDWIVIAICVVLFLSFVLWATSGERPMYESIEDYEPREGDAEHPSERLTGKMPELIAGYGIQSLEVRCGQCHELIRPHRLFGTVCGCLVPPGCPTPPTDREILEEEFDFIGVLECTREMSAEHMNVLAESIREVSQSLGIRCLLLPDFVKVARVEQPVKPDAEEH